MDNGDSKEREFVGLQIHEEIRIRSSKEKGAEIARQAFVVGVLGDFGGTGTSATSTKKGGQRFKNIDRDNFDDVMAAMAPACSVEVANFIQKGGVPFQLSLVFQELDDFHPDYLVHKLPVLKKLFEARKAVGEPDKLEKILREVGVSIATEEPSPVKKEVPEDETSEPVTQKPLEPGLSPSGLLDAIIEESPAETVKEGHWHPSGDLGDFIKEIVAPVADSTDYAAQDRVRGKIDEIIEGQVRAILHHPSFQQLEATWRSLFRLVMETETGPDLKIKILDVSKEEFLKNLAGAGEIEKTLLYQLVYESECTTPGGEPFGLLIGDYRFGPGSGDMTLLEYIAGIATMGGVPFITAAAPSLLGLKEFRELLELDNLSHLKEETFSAWWSFRQGDFANKIGICLPSILLRLPYGPDSDPVDTFEFDETVEGKAHQDYLWGNPAMAFARVVTRAFASDGWEMEPHRFGTLTDLPGHIYDEDGEKVIKPCAEVLMKESMLEQILEAGFIPFVTIKNTDRVEIWTMQSVARTRLFGG